MTTSDYKESAACIAYDGKQWLLLCTGSFEKCKGEQKRISYAYQRVKVIYEFNLPNYGINQ